MLSVEKLYDVLHRSSRAETLSCVEAKCLATRALREVDGSRVGVVPPTTFYFPVSEELADE